MKIIGAIFFLTLAACAPTDANILQRAPGYLQGHVTIGPLTPVVRVGAPTPTLSPDVCNARTLIVFSEDGKQELARQRLDAQCNFRFVLAPGNYYFDALKLGIDRVAGLPVTVVIESGKTVRLDLEIDTGIR